MCLFYQAYASYGGKLAIATMGPLVGGKSVGTTTASSIELGGLMPVFSIDQSSLEGI